MSMEERMTWVTGIVGLAVAAVYFVIVGSELGETAVTEIAYQRTLLIAIGASIVLTIVGSIVAAVGTAVGSAIRSEISGEDDGALAEIDRTDERDKMISRRGDLIGMYVSSAGMVGVLALAMLEYEHFWIANALYAAFVAGTFVTFVVKAAAYRRGF